MIGDFCNDIFNCIQISLKILLLILSILVANRFLEKGVLKFGQSEFKIVSPPSQFNRIDNDVFDEERANEEDKLPSAKVLVRGIPKHWTEDILLALLEREQVGGGTVVSMHFQTGDEQTIVQFEDYQGKSSTVTTPVVTAVNGILFICLNRCV